MLRGLFSARTVQFEFGFIQFRKWPHLFGHHNTLFRLAQPCPCREARSLACLVRQNWLCAKLKPTLPPLVSTLLHSPSQSQKNRKAHYAKTLNRSCFEQAISCHFSLFIAFCVKNAERLDLRWSYRLHLEVWATKNWKMDACSPIPAIIRVGLQMMASTNVMTLGKRWIHVK